MLKICSTCGKFHKFSEICPVRLERIKQRFFRVCNELSLSPQARAKMGIMAAGKSAEKNDPIFQIFGDDNQE